MAVDTVLSALHDRLPDYTLIRDCVAGQRAIKKKGTVYLPVPDPDEALLASGAFTPAGQARYDAYLMRAVFYGVTGRTLRGLVGLVFDKDPAIEIPTSLEPVRADASGGGEPLDEHAKTTLQDVMSVGRSGLLTDYPVTNGKATSAKDAREGNIRPTIRRYAAEDVINWRTRTVGSKIMLSLVVLREQVVVEDDGFAETFATQYRVLRLGDDLKYYIEIHPEGDKRVTRYDPTDGKGNPLREIPFTFVGSEDNSPSVDQPPLLDIAALNKHHYMNSADYEESVFLVGQPTPVFSGLTKQWVEDVFTVERDDGHGNKRRETKVRLGSRAAVPLPENGSAELLQADPNTMASDAMEKKEQQMIALGAKLIENSGTQQTATEATLDSVLDNSVLANAARNVSKAYRQALRWAELFISGNIIEDDNQLDYQLSTDFAARLMTSQDREQIVSMWVKKAITFGEMRWNLKRTGTAYEDDEKAKEELAAEREDSIEFEARAVEAMAAAGTPRGPNDPGQE